MPSIRNKWIAQHLLPLPAFSSLGALPDTDGSLDLVCRYNTDLCPEKKVMIPGTWYASQAYIYHFRIVLLLLKIDVLHWASMLCQALTKYIPDLISVNPGNSGMRQGKDVLFHFFKYNKFNCKEIKQIVQSNSRILKIQTCVSFL